MRSRRSARRALTLWASRPSREYIAPTEAAGLMAQAGHSSVDGNAFPAGDLKTARMFGANVARSLACMTCPGEMEVAQ